jgi:leucyl-tRNA synthetase
VSYIVIAPENSILIDIMSKVENVEDIKAYISQAKAKDEIERTNADKEKTGVCVKGISAINPANGETIPVWISDYVLGDYGTGAVMAVPAHDDRDYVFANKYNLPIKEVVIPHVIDKRNPPIPGKKTVTRVGILDKLELRLGNVKTALEKIENGSYGICKICGEKIEEDRLEANPASLTCKKHMETA